MKPTCVYSADILGVQRAAAEASHRTLHPNFPASLEILSAVRRKQAVVWNGLVFNPVDGGNKVGLTGQAVPAKRADNQVRPTILDIRSRN